MEVSAAEVLATSTVVDGFDYRLIELGTVDFVEQGYLDAVTMPMPPFLVFLSGQLSRFLLRNTLLSRPCSGPRPPSNVPQLAVLNHIVECSMLCSFLFP